MDAAKSLFREDVLLQPCDCAVGAFVARAERFAIGSEELGFGEEATQHRDDALMKGKNGAKRAGHILLRRAGADGLLQCLEGEEHVGEALFEDGQEESEAVVEVDVEGCLGAAGLLGDGACGGAGEAACSDQSFGGGDNCWPSAWPASDGSVFFFLPHSVNLQ